MTKLIMILAVAGLAAVLTACGTAEPTSQPTAEPAAVATDVPAEPTEPLTPTMTAGDPLAGTRWALASLEGSEPVSGTEVTLVFGKDGSVGGSDGCNRYGATYAVDGDSLTIEQPMTATLMACEDAVMQQADQYRAALAAVRTYAVVSATLTLRSETEDLLTYEAQAQDLAGTSWSALSYNNGRQAVVSVAAGTQITATFGLDGTLTGFAGCNRYAGPYEAAEGAIGIGPLSSTRMACPEPAMSQEAQYLAALATAATYAIEAGKLELRTADGALAASYLESASE